MLSTLKPWNLPMPLFNKTYKDINLSPENVVAPNESLDPDVGLCYLERKLSIQVSECIYVFMIHLSLVFSITSDSITKEIRTQASKRSTQQQLLTRWDNWLFFLDLFVCVERFNLVLANVRNSKLTHSIVKKNCTLRNGPISSLSDFLDLFLIEVAFNSFQRCLFDELILPYAWTVFICFANRVKEIPYHRCAWLFIWTT